jgi:D-alanyl-D-alanine carboxypeptidase (penicillin-binding protein 5/6)
MSSRPRSVLTEGVRRSRRRRRPPRRRARALRPLFAVVLAALLVVTLGGLVDELSKRDATGPERNAAAPKLLPPVGSALGGTPGGTDEHGRFALNFREPDIVRLRFKRKPRSGLLFDIRTGRVLWREEPVRKLAIASLTKMMTALIVAEKDDPHDRVMITKQAVTTAGSGVGVLPKGKRVQLEALLNGLLLVSGNDAAVALAQHTAGSVGAFVRVMNRRAKELGLSCTNFTSPHGLTDRGNHSCAADLATLARADLAQRRIRLITRRSRAIVRFPVKGGKLFLYNNNPLIRAHYPGITGLKTGYTDKAGSSIVATAKRGRSEIGVVLLHSYDPAAQARKLLDRGFVAERRLQRGG